MIAALSPFQSLTDCYVEINNSHSTNIIYFSITEISFMLAYVGIVNFGIWLSDTTAGQDL